MNFRNYDPEKDQKAAHRIWQETGWLENEKRAKAMMDIFVQAGRTLVADINGEAECLVSSLPGVIRYLEEDLPFAGVTAVTTSRIARKQGFARRLTAR